MKHFLFLVAILAVVVTTTGAQLSQDPRFTEKKLEMIDQNLVRSLESPISGVQATAAQTVRDIKARAPNYTFSHNLTIALMRVMKDEEAQVGSRILAALALSELNSEVGNYAIKMQRGFTEVPRLKHVCTWLTYDKAFEQAIARANKRDASKEVAAK